MATFECNCHWCGNGLVRKVQAKSKNVRLHFCDLNCKAEYQRTKKPVTREWLFEHYIEKKMDCNQIGAIVNRDGKSVWNWLRDFKIPTRSRGGGVGGASQAGSFKKGQKNAFEGRKHTAETKARLSQIAKADGRVPYDPSVGPNGGRRGAEHPSWKGGITAERSAFYATDEWKAAAREVCKRDRETCQKCGKKRVRGDGQQFDIHHIVGFACVELRATVSNLVLLCEPCHYWVHGKSNTEREFLK